MIVSVLADILEACFYVCLLTRWTMGISSGVLIPLSKSGKCTHYTGQMMQNNSV